MLKGAETVSRKCAENVPESQGFHVGVAGEAMAPQAFRGKVKELISPPGSSRVTTQLSKEKRNMNELIFLEKGWL